MIYNSGYLRYSNPYFVNPGASIYNYSQPITVIYNGAANVPASDVNTSDQVLKNAVAAFQQNDFDAAIDMTNKGIMLYPDDAVLHEFRALVLFAQQDYQQSAATIHSVLAVGPGWDWTTLSSMYSSVPVYTEQLRTLESFTKANPQDAASHFLLAYHYMSCGYPESAAVHLRQVVRLIPNDRVAADLLKMILPPEPGETLPTNAAQQTTRELPPGVVHVAPESLVGVWKATRADGSIFDLVLTNDAGFTWKFAPKDQASQEFGGTYSVEVEENLLVLERREGGSLIAEITPMEEGKFNFRVLGAGDEDPGLDFSR